MIFGSSVKLFVLNNSAHIKPEGSCLKALATLPAHILLRRKVGVPQYFSNRFTAQIIIH